MHGSFRRRAGSGTVKKGSKRGAKFALEGLEVRLVMSVPAAPSGLTASAASSSRIVVGWRDNSLDETGFVVERAAVGGQFAPVATVGANVTSYANDGLTGGARYTYRVAALNGSGRSEYSYPIIANALATFQTNPHPEPQRIGTYRWGLPGDRIDVVSTAQNNVFYEGQPINFELRWNGAHGTTYEVRNYWGEMVDSGPLSAPGTPLNVRVNQPGWYKIYVFGNTTSAEFGDVKGGTTFCVFRNDPNFPQMPAATNPVERSSQIVRGVTAMGPTRLNAWDVTRPDDMIWELAPEVALAKQYYLGRDAVRPRDLLIAFTNGTRDLNDPSKDGLYLDGVRKIVQRFHNDVKYYECRNEPHDYQSAEQMVEEMRQLYNVVKSVDPTCKVIGPSLVNLTTGYSLAFLDRFLAAGGGQFIDGLSFHTYNAIVGDVATARHNFGNLQAILTKHGVEDIEKWQTEQGSYAAMYGTAQPRVQGRWTLLQQMIQEQYGIPKEHNNIWYDQSGFWDVPAFWLAVEDTSLMPAPAVMRVYSEEVYGTTFNRAFDFGPGGNDLYIGNLYTGPSGKGVAAFMSTGSTTGKVTLKVTGGASQLKVTDAMGVSKMIAVVNGRAELDVPESPVYVALPAGQAVDVVARDYGTNLAQEPGVTLRTSGDGRSPVGAPWENSISKVTNGRLDTYYTGTNYDSDVWFDNTPAGQQVWFEVDLGREQTVGRVNIFSSVPWSLRGSLLDYELQYERGGVWTTIERVQENPKTIGIYSPWTHSTVDSFYSDRSVFQHEFAPVSTTKLRLLVHEVTYGGGATKMVAEAGGQTGYHLMNLREIEVFGPGDGEITGVPTPATAVFGGVDATTKGSWKGKYGSAGYSLAGGAVSIPAGVKVTTTGHQSWTWAASSVDARALQKPDSATDRMAGTWYTDGQFDVDLRITNGKTYKLSAYLLDWEFASRAEQITVYNGDNGKALHTYAASDFTGGKYVSWTVSGHVRLRITRSNGTNAVMSGLFFDEVGGGSTPVVPPTIAVSGAAEASEGGVYTLNLGALTNPSGRNLVQYVVKWGDGTSDTYATAGDKTHVFADGPLAGNVTVDLIDDTGARYAAAGSLAVAVRNVNPTVAVTSVAGSSAVVSAPLRYQASASDAGAADVAAGLAYRWTVTRDGLPYALPVGVRTDAAMFEFVPTVAGTYVVTARVTDKDGGAGQSSSTVTVSGTGTPSSNTASFVAEDGATAGNWKGVYGADGYSVVADATALPAYATKSSAGDAQWTWDAGPADARALQRAGSGRVAATLYGNSFTIDLNLSGGSRRVAAYFVDWDGGARVQQVEVLDGDTGAVLDSRTVSGFGGGKYLSWNLGGHVTLRVTRVAGVNAVLSGLFFGGGGGAVDQTPPAVVSRTPAPGATGVASGANVSATFGEDVQAGTVAFSLKDAAGNDVAGSVAYDAATRTVTLDPGAALLPSATYTATLSGARDLAGNAMAAVSWSFTTAAAPSAGTSASFVGEDAATRGNWKGMYGADGYNVIGDARAYRPWASVTTSGGDAYTWAANDYWSAGSLQKASATATDRVAACWYSSTSFTIDVDLTDGQSHRLALYFLDWDTTTRRETVTVSDATTGAVLDTRTMADFSQGKYLVYDVKGHVRITISNLGGLNAVMSGLFFG